MQDDEYTPEQRVEDAVSGIVAMTAKQVATRAGVEMKIAQRVLKRMVARGDLEQRGRRYRIDNASAWVECKEDLPALGVPCCIEFDGSSKGYKVTLTPRTPRTEAPAAPQAPSKPAPKPRPKAGQIRLFEKSVKSA